MMLKLLSCSAALLAVLATPADSSAQDQDGPVIALPAANALDMLGLDDVARAKPGFWSDFFIDHQPNTKRMAAIPPQIARLATAAQASYTSQDFPACLAQSREVLRLLPDFPPSLLVYGTAAFRLMRYGDCKTALERFVDVSPGEVWRTQVLGHALYSLGEFEAARNHYMLVIDGTPEAAKVSLEARRGLALANYKMGESQLALEGLNVIVGIDPSHADAHTWLAQLHFNRDDYDQALASARKAMELAPFEPRAYFHAFRVLFEMADLAEDPKAAAKFEAEAGTLQARWQVLNTAASEIVTLENRLLYHIGDPSLLRALATQYQVTGDTKSLISTLGQLIATIDVLDPTSINRRIFAIKALQEAGAEDQAKTLKEETQTLFPGAEGLPEL